MIKTQIAGIETTVSGFVANRILAALVSGITFCELVDTDSNVRAMITREEFDAFCSDACGNFQQLGILDDSLMLTSAFAGSQ